MISPKQAKILAFPYSKYDALICDGAVRSGKTSIMMWAFVRWAMENFSGQRFGVCGRTVDSCTKNIIVPFTAMSLAKERYLIRWRRGDKVMEVRRGAVTNYFEVFGGKDEASYTLIQGRTLAGVLLDEVVLMPRSFVEQALTRCSVDGAKLWFSCNPGSPQHWFYTEWIQRNKERNALYLHFEMTDNPGLSQKTLERYQSMFTGVFYDRYIRGLWVLAEGLIYPMFDESCIVDELPERENTMFPATTEHLTRFLQDFGAGTASRPRASASITIPGARTKRTRQTRNTLTKLKSSLARRMSKALSLTRLPLRLSRSCGGAVIWSARPTTM